MNRTAHEHARTGAGPAVVLALASGLLGGCGGGTNAPATTTIQLKGSDTMVNVTQAWAEEYKRVAPGVDVEVSGGGSGVGIAALARGTIDVAASSRNMKPEEIAQAERSTGSTPADFIVGYDALAVYVNHANPLSAIGVDQLREVFVENGTLTKWSQLGVAIPGSDSDEIVRVSRQSSSGTYEFFREHVLGKHDFKLGSRDMNGSKEVVELVAHTPTALGYSGMGYATAGVKMLGLIATPGAAPVAPSVEATLDKSYPLARSLHLYTLGQPEGEVRRFVDWIRSEAGQRILQDNGYVPIPASDRTAP
jgi:phosphate transport system substrate-binding protein